MTESEDGAIITLRSTLPGQIAAWGATRGLVEEYCNALARIEPRGNIPDRWHAVRPEWSPLRTGETSNDLLTEED